MALAAPRALLRHAFWRLATGLSSRAPSGSTGNNLTFWISAVRVRLHVRLTPVRSCHALWLREGWRGALRGSARRPLTRVGWGVWHVLHFRPCTLHQEGSKVRALSVSKSGGRAIAPTLLGDSKGLSVSAFSSEPTGDMIIIQVQGA